MISERPFYAKNSSMYKNMINHIYCDSICSNPRVYDPKCHTLETRSSRHQHAGCNVKTPTEYSGKTLEQAESTFWALATRSGFTAEDQIRAIYIRKKDGTTYKTLWHIYKLV